MSLSSGTTLGPYTVTAKIREGGMGEVYRARDAKSGRVTKESHSLDPGEFEQRAQVTKMTA